MLSDYPAALCTGSLRGKHVFLLTKGEDLTSDESGHGYPIEKTEYHEKAYDIASHLFEYRALDSASEDLLENCRQKNYH